MNMLTLRIIMNALPEKHKEITQTLLSLIALPEGMRGCVGYDICTNIEDVNSFNLMSEWQTRKQLDEYMNSAGFEVLLGTRSLLSAPLEIRIASVRRATPSVADRKLKKPSIRSTVDQAKT